MVYKGSFDKKNLNLFYSFVLGFDETLIESNVSFEYLGITYRGWVYPMLGWGHNDHKPSGWPGALCI